MLSQGFLVNFHVILQKYFVFFCITIALLLLSLSETASGFLNSPTTFLLTILLFSLAIVCDHLWPPVSTWISTDRNPGSSAPLGAGWHPGFRGLPHTAPSCPRGDLPCPASFLLGSPALSYPCYPQASRCKVWSSLGRTKGNGTNFANYQYSVFSAASTIFFTNQSSQATFFTVHTHTVLAYFHLEGF